MDLLAPLLAIALLASLAGVELCVAVFFHPALDRLEGQAWVTARARGAASLGRAMPGWYIAATLAAGLAAVQAIVAGATLAIPLWIGCLLALGVVIVVTILRLVPLNTVLAAGGTSGGAASLRTTAARWDRLHRWRTAALLVVLAVEVLAAVPTAQR